MTNPLRISATIDAIDDRAGGVRIITLAPETPFTWRAGQYANLGIGGLEPRSFSIASAPASHGKIVFHIRNSGKGVSARIFDARIGDTLTIEGPFGEMTPDPVHERPVIMVAGGTGIAPMLSIASDILRKGLTDEPITLIYGARSEHDIYCRPELDALISTGNVTLHLAIGAHTPDQELRRLGLNLAHHIAYVSGPEPMMLPVQKVLTDHLADPSRIFTDARLDDLMKP